MIGDSGIISRRQFIITTAAGVAIGLAGYPPFLRAAEEVDLAVISGEPAAATRKALEVVGGVARFMKKGQRVIIKPNMSFARTPDFAATTHPQVVVAVAQACIDAGAREVLVLDHTLQRAELCLERAGIRDACRSLPGVHVLALQDRKFFREIRIPQEGSGSGGGPHGSSRQRRADQCSGRKIPFHDGRQPRVEGPHGTDLGPGELPLPVQYQRGDRGFGNGDQTSTDDPGRYPGHGLRRTRRARRRQEAEPYHCRRGSGGG